MPLYTYRCRNCSLRTDFLVGVNQEKLRLCCPACGSEDLEKEFSGFSIGGFSKGSSSKCSSCSGGNCSTCS